MSHVATDYRDTMLLFMWGVHCVLVLDFHFYLFIHTTSILRLFVHTGIHVFDVVQHHAFIDLCWLFCMHTFLGTY